MKSLPIKKLFFRGSEIGTFKTAEIALAVEGFSHKINRINNLLKIKIPLLQIKRICDIMVGLRC